MRPARMLRIWRRVYGVIAPPARLGSPVVSASGFPALESPKRIESASESCSKLAPFLHLQARRRIRPSPSRTWNSESAYCPRPVLRAPSGSRQQALIRGARARRPQNGGEAMTHPDHPRDAESTTGAGTPAPSDRNSLTIGADGPLLLHDVHFIEQMAHFNREKVPERQPHAKGAGAFGDFEPTEEVPQ